MYPISYLLQKGSYDASPRDPDVFYHNGYYYHCYAFKNEIYLRKSPSLEKLCSAEKVKVFTPQGIISKEVWAPELHIINDMCYIYVAMDDGDNHNHRMYVLSNKSTNPMDSYTNLGQISDTTNKWAIDGTVLKYNGELYFVWSGWEGDDNVCQNIYIAHMKNPYTIDSERVMISTPTYEWEKMDCDGIKDSYPYVNEGPFILYTNKYIYVIYSGSGCWGNNYCLGAIRVKIGRNILNFTNWEKLEKPLLKRNKSVNGPGHASFMQNSPDNKLYFSYHAFNGDCSSGGADTYAVIQEFKIENDIPILGEAIKK